MHLFDFTKFIWNTDFIQFVLPQPLPGPLLRFLYTEIANHGRPPDAQDLWLAPWASQILIAGPPGQQKLAGLEMKSQYIL